MANRKPAKALLMLGVLLAIATVPPAARCAERGEQAARLRALEDREAIRDELEKTPAGWRFSKRVVKGNLMPRPVTP